MLNIILSSIPFSCIEFINTYEKMCFVRSFMCTELKIGIFNFPCKKQVRNHELIENCKNMIYISDISWLYILNQRLEVIFQCN